MLNEGSMCPHESSDVYTRLKPCHLDDCHLDGIRQNRERTEGEHPATYDVRFSLCVEGDP